ncbi:MAG TPA: aconitase family protein [Trueperaceae bacterium]
MTRIERLLGATAGEEVELPVDLIVTDDWTTPALRAPLESLGCERSAVPIVLVRDHTLSEEHYRGEEKARVKRLRETEEWFVSRFGATLISGQGIQHHVLPGSGLLRPGMLVLGNDSHTPTLAAYGVTAFAAQPTTIAVAVHTGKLVLRVPESLLVRVEGRLPAGVSVRDASLTLLDLLRGGGQVPRLATGMALEFSGPGLVGLSESQRAVLANATPEAVAVTCTFPLHGEAESGQADLLLDLSAARPSLARSGQPADVISLSEFGHTRVDRVFVGTCAGGTYEEVRDFAEALGGARVAVPTIVAPASLETEARLRREGILARLEAAGVTLLPPGCGPCFGFGVGRLADDEVAVVTGNRNSLGRMGSPRAQIHLASGRTAGEAALRGSIGARQGGQVERPSGARPVVVWPRSGNVVRLLGTITTDDITPSAVPGVGTSSDPDPGVVRRLLFHHLDPSSAERNLAGAVIVADENFGVGSNRASSVRALQLAGVAAVIVRSFAPLYAMGARDEGLLLLRITEDEFYDLATPEAQVVVDPDGGSVRVGGSVFSVSRPSPYEQQLRAAGGVVAWLRSRQGGPMAQLRPLPT